MNKNQKQIRRLAAQNHGETFNVCKAYDQTVPNSVPFYSSQYSPKSPAKTKHEGEGCSQAFKRRE